MKRTVKLICVVVACLFTATSCALRTQLQPPQAVSASASATPQSGNQLAGLGPDVIGASGAVVGVNLYAVSNYSATETTFYGQRMISYIKNDLHAQAVDIVWNLYALNQNDNYVTTESTTLSADNVGILTQIAQQQHLMVEYRPLIFVQNASNDWEGLLRPTDPATWFNSYYQQNVPYLEMAQKYHINEYVVGTEMDDLNSDVQWPTLLGNSAKIYHGEISYATHQTRYFPPVNPGEPPPSTPLTGVDMYEKLELPGSASLSAVEAAYDAYFAGVPEATLRRTAIQETGIEAMDGAYSDPANLTKSGTLDEQIQSNYFTAGCEAVKKYHLRGIFFWKVDLADNPAHPAASESVFEGRPGADAISKCESIISGGS
jgi:hypothetical protein